MSTAAGGNHARGGMDGFYIVACSFRCVLNLNTNKICKRLVLHSVLNVKLVEDCDLLLLDFVVLAQCLHNLCLLPNFSFKPITLRKTRNCDFLSLYFCHSVKELATLVD